MTIFYASLIVVVFIAIAHLLELPKQTTEVMQRSKAAAADLRSRTLSDEEKETLVQGHAIRLMRLFVMITGSCALALGVPIGIVALLELAGVAELEPVLEATITWEFLTASSLIICALVFVVRRRTRGETD